MKSFLVLLVAVALLAPGKSFAKDNMRIGGDVGIGLPTGDFGDAANMGFGLTGSFHYYIQPNLILGGTLGYYTFGGTEREYFGETYDGPDFNIIPIMGLINYKFGTTGMIPFIGAELGFVSFGVSMESESDSEMYFGINILGGIEQKINDKLSWRATAKYNVIMTDGSNATFLSVSGGLYFKL